MDKETQNLLTKSQFRIKSIQGKQTDKGDCQNCQDTRGPVYKGFHDLLLPYKIRKETPFIKLKILDIFAQITTS